MRIVYLGTSDYAATVLRRLAASEHRPALVITQPDRRRGRGRRTGSPPAAEAARELELELLQTEATEEPESLARIRASQPELGAVCAFGQLIREPLLGELDLLNVHPSLLPRWRGAAPIERAIMAGDEQTGVSIMRLTEGLDSGPVALREPLPIGDADYGTLSPRLAALGGELLVRALDLQAAAALELRDQDEQGVTYAEKITAADRRLDPERSAIELEHVVRALNPHIGAYLELEQGERLGVSSAVAEPGELPPGRLDDSDGLRLGCSDGVLRLRELRPPGGRSMDAESYLRGHPLPRLA